MTSLDANAVIDDAGGLDFLARTLGPVELPQDLATRFAAMARPASRPRAVKSARPFGQKRAIRIVVAEAL